MAISMWVAVGYFVVTIFLAIHMIWDGSPIAATAATTACAFCFIGTADFVGSFHARHVTNQTIADLVGGGVLASILIASGVILTVASGLSLTVFGVAVGGVYWALFGIVAAIVATRKEHAIALNRLFAA